MHACLCYHGKAPAEAEQVTNIILNAWGREHNKAIEYALDDSVMATVENPLDYSIQRLVELLQQTQILPSPMTYLLKCTI